MVDYIVVIVTGMPRLFAREGRAIPLCQENLLAAKHERAILEAIRSIDDRFWHTQPRFIVRSRQISPQPIRCRSATQKDKNIRRAS